MKTINELCDSVRQTAYEIQVFHGNGHLEKVYENARRFAGMLTFFSVFFAFFRG